MKATQKLHDIGQSIWLDNLTRGLLASGKLREYIEEFSVTGLTSNPTIFDHAVRNGHDYDDAIRQKVKEGKSSEALFLALAIEDLRQAADLFRPIHIRTDGVDGWVSLEVSPCWRGTRQELLLPPRLFTLARGGLISSSKFPGPVLVSWPLKRPHLQACLLT